jgi:hypothetical protein
MVPGVTVNVYEGPETLEVVGESYRQDNLWAIVDTPRTGNRVDVAILAVLVPETANEHDANAIAVWVSGLHVGYLAREDALEYRPGLERLMADGPVALRGRVVGGGYEDGLARLGVFLDHDPIDFGLADAAASPVTYQPRIGELRTGLSQAFQTDLLDDSYDLGWLYALPTDTRRGVHQLRSLLESDPDPIDRHFMYSELESRLYRLRDVEPAALADYDEACTQHDSEMSAIRPALHAKFGAMPLLETYRQQCIRQQKAKDFTRGLWWAERGLELYGNDAASQDWTDDLRNRAGNFRSKLSAAAPTERRQSTALAATGEMESLTCGRCQMTWERVRVRGRKPLLCPSCAET